MDPKTQPHHGVSPRKWDFDQAGRSIAAGGTPGAPGVGRTSIQPGPVVTGSPAGLAVSRGGLAVPRVGRSTAAGLGAAAGRGAGLGSGLAGELDVRGAPGGVAGRGALAGPGAVVGSGGSAGRAAGGGTGGHGGAEAGRSVGAPVLRRAAAQSAERSADVVDGLPVGRQARILPPQRRWEAAVAARPLEAPQALPARFHALASAVTGAALPPRYTTGPATRHALAAAGALGATTGSVVHLPAPPARVPVTVLAHELSHARQPVRRPRFLLSSMSGAVDDDERGALAAGRGLLTNAATGGNGPETGAGLVDRLPVGGGAGAVGAVTEVATRAARAAVIEAGASPPSGGTGFGDLGGGFPSGGSTSTATSVQEGGGTSSGTTGGGTTSAAGASTESAPAATNAGATGGAAPLDIDTVLEAVEERLLREIERRGGRWAGVF